VGRDVDNKRWRASATAAAWWGVFLPSALLVLLAVWLGMASRFSPWLVMGTVALLLLCLGLVLFRLRSGETRWLEYWREIVPCFISVHDRRLRIVQSNALFDQYFGQRRGQHCYRVYKGRDSPCQQCPVLKSFADGRVHSAQERLLTPDGRRLEVVVTSAPLHGARGQVDAVVEMFTDITEVKKLERQLALMGRAVAGMAHRIKNIVMGLEGGIFVVNTGMENDDQDMVKEGWEMVQRNVAKVSTIMRDLLFCAKERQPRLQPGVSPQRITEEVFQLFHERLRNDDIELLLERTGPEHQGNYDGEGLHNLLSNLVANAIDACRFDPQAGSKSHRIIIRCQGRPDGSTLLEVEDNGAGIPEDVGSKLFEEFFSTKGTEGTGIGLLVVRKIAEEHGGRVDFESRPGEGTCFRVLIKPAPAAAGN